MDEAGSAVGFLRRFNVRPEVGPVNQQPPADNVFLPDLG
jgi:hypothetical protein